MPKLRPIIDLCEALGARKGAVYYAAHQGHLPVVFVGAKMMLTQAAFEYHAKHGFGR